MVFSRFLRPLGDFVWSVSLTPAAFEKSGDFVYVLCVLFVGFLGCFSKVCLVFFFPPKGRLCGGSVLEILECL